MIMQDLLHLDGNSTYTINCTSTVYEKVTGTFIFVIIWPFIVVDFGKRFPIGRPASALLGAVLMVSFHVINQPEAYRTEGELENLQTLFLLIGMMILSYYFDREGLLTIISVKIFGNSIKFQTILWRVCVLSGVLSAFITNDAACLIVAPLVLNMYAAHSDNQQEFLLLSLGIATSANIGSAATIFGNPQNILIAASDQTNVNLLDFIIAEMPISIVSMLVNIALLMLYRRVAKNCCRSWWRRNTVQHGNQENQPIISKESETFEEQRSRNGIEPHNEYDDNTAEGDDDDDRDIYIPISSIMNYRHQQSLVQSVNRNRSYSNLSQASGSSTTMKNVIPMRERSIGQKIFIVWLILVFVVLVLLLAISVPQLKEHGVYFTLGLVPSAAAVFTMVVDSILNKKYPQHAMTKIDWTVILMFMGLFVWIQGFKETCIPEIILEHFKQYMDLKTPWGVVLFTLFVLFGSNIFSNVPLVILLTGHLRELCGEEECGNSFKVGALILAWVSTIAGNLTLIGSIANLIVAEKAKQSKANYNLSFYRHLPYGFVSTIIITTVTVPMVYGLGLLASKLSHLM